jgi:hypothetical protein
VIRDRRGGWALGIYRLQARLRDPTPANMPLRCLRCIGTPDSPHLMSKCQKIIDAEHCGALRWPFQVFQVVPHTSHTSFVASAERDQGAEI